MSDPIEDTKKVVAKKLADIKAPGDARQNRPDAYSIAAENDQKGELAKLPDAGGNQNYVSPGAAEFGGGPGMGNYYKVSAENHISDNDGQQASNAAALNNSVSNMKGDRGPQSTENAVLSGREAATRTQQGKALNLSMKAAMGGAPSAAAYNQKLSENKINSGLSGMQGQAKGLAGLGSAQISGNATAGELAGDEAFKGGMGRSKEIGDAIGTYGAQAGQVRGQDLTRLGMNNQNSLFNTGLNNDWKVGNANLASAQANLGTGQDQMDQQWFGESMKPGDAQFQMDQQMAAQQAGAGLDSAAAARAKDNANRQNTEAVVGGFTQAGLTGLGSLGGPAGAALGGMAGTAINSATRKFY